MAGDAAIELCEAVKNTLNNDTFSHTFTATRVYDLTAELKDDSITHVNTALFEEEGEIASRGSTDEEIAINIAVRRKCDVSSNAVPDAMMGLLKEFKDTFVGKRLATATLGDAWCYGFDRKPAYFPEHIRKFRQFTGLITLKFTLSLALS